MADTNKWKSLAKHIKLYTFSRTAILPNLLKHSADGEDNYWRIPLLLQDMSLHIQSRTQIWIKNEPREEGSGRCAWRSRSLERLWKNKKLVPKLDMLQWIRVFHVHAAKIGGWTRDDFLQMYRVWKQVEWECVNLFSKSFLLLQLCLITKC